MADDKHPVSWLLGNVSSPNIAPDLSEDVLTRLGTDVVYGYDVDEASRIVWKEKALTGLDIAMQVMQTKTTPWQNAANVKHPLIAVASIQFAARAYPNVVKGVDVVKARVIGEDPKGMKEARAKRVSQHMSWQLTEQMTEWEEDTDKLLHCLPIFGMYYRKTYFDPLLGRNCSDGRSPLSVVVNNDVKSLERARRITDEVYLYKNEVIERERAGIFSGDISNQLVGDPQEKPQDLFLEQHCFADLDGDDYEEPYIVTVHKDTSRVVRIVARYDADGVKTDKGGRKVSRIEPVHYFTKYTFIPSPDGKFHDLGFSQLLGPLNETINTLINQMLDAGTLANRQGGFIGRGIRWKGGAMVFAPGEWKPVDVMGGVLKENIVPLPIKEPSGVLFQLLGSLSETADRLASVSEALTGEMPSQNTPATTVLAMIEQGLKVFTSIYKRVFRSLKIEYGKLYRLNGMHVPEAEYYRVLDSQYAAYRADYSLTDLDIVPVADPTISSEAQRLARARAEYETMGQNPTVGGRIQILRNYYDALEAKNVDKLLPQEEIDRILSPPPPPPDPDMLRLELETLKQKNDYELEMERLDLERLKIESEVELAKAKAIQAIADAEAKEAGHQFEEYRHEVEQLSTQTKLAIEAMKENNRAREAARNNAGDEPGGTRDVEAAGGNEEGVPIPAGGPDGPGGEGGNGDVPLPDLGGGDGSAGSVPDGGSVRLGPLAGDKNFGE